MGYGGGSMTCSSESFAPNVCAIARALSAFFEVSEKSVGAKMSGCPWPYPSSLTDALR